MDRRAFLGFLALAPLVGRLPTEAEPDPWTEPPPGHPPSPLGHIHDYPDPGELWAERPLCGGKQSGKTLASMEEFYHTIFTLRCKREGLNLGVLTDVGAA